MISIADDNFVKGSIERLHYKEYNKRFLYRYRGVVADLTNGNSFVLDHLIDDMHQNNIIEKEAYLLYEESLRRLFSGLSACQHETDEMLFSNIEHLRNDILSDQGKEHLEIRRRLQIDSKAYDIDQRYLLNEKLAPSKALFIFIDECKYITLLKEFYSGTHHDNITFVIHERDKDILLDLRSKHDTIIDFNDTVGFNLSDYQVPENSIVLGFGEWFIGAFKNLNVDAFVCCESEEIISRGLTNAVEKDKVHFIYVPKHFNILKHFSVVEKSILNYRVYDWLLKEVGESVYKKTLEQIIKDHAAYLISHDSDMNHQLISHMNIGDKNFLEHRVQAINDHMKKHADGLVLDNMIYKDRYGKSIKVNYMKLSKDMNYDMEILSYDSSQNVRKLFRETYLPLGMVMNFLFFTTEKTISTYNKLRKNRSDEQYYKTGWHMDYMLSDVEYFPLYNKGMIGMNQSGEIVFKRQQLEAGSIHLNHHFISWDKEQVNTDAYYDFKIYSPLYYKNNKTYYLEDVCEVGQDRINVIVINNEVVSVKKDAVLLPSIGVVLSFNEEYFYSVFGTLDYSKWEIKLSLDSNKDLKWAFGGGMFLIHDYEAYDTTRKLEKAFTHEGWLYNLSKQTQDSETFRLDKHPRTAIGITAENELFVIVCAGRSVHSVGADYFDLIDISRDIFKNVKYLMNLDGGASSLIGAVVDGEVYPLNDITYTNDSCSGMLRPLNSMIKIEL